MGPSPGDGADCGCLSLALRNTFVVFASPPTALLMLEAIVPLQPGDVVVQNGATSAVGQVCGPGGGMRCSKPGGGMRLRDEEGIKSTYAGSSDASA